MAKLSVEYDKDGKLDCVFEDNTIMDDVKLLQAILRLADNISLEILKKNNNVGPEIDATMVNICNDFLKASDIYQVNKKILNTPVPAVSPSLSFIKFRK